MKTTKSAPNLDEITDNTVIYRVTDLDLAACLLAVGVPLRKDPPFTATRLKNGQVAWVFNFHGKTRDGQKQTGQIIKDYTRDGEYIQKHPVDLLTGAMCALKNRARLTEWMNSGKVKPWVAFRSPSGQSTILVIEGTKQHEKYVTKKWIRCDPFEDQKPRSKKK